MDLCCHLPGASHPLGPVGENVSYTPLTWLTFSGVNPNLPVPVVSAPVAGFALCWGRDESVTSTLDVICQTSQMSFPVYFTLEITYPLT